MITGAAVLISNDYELEMIHKATGLANGALLERCGIIVTTLGEKGSTIATRQETIPIPAVSPTVVKDPTGAGDAYRAGFIKGWNLNKNWEECAQMGATVASFAVEKVGTQEHHFTLSMFEQRHGQSAG